MGDSRYRKKLKQVTIQESLPVTQQIPSVTQMIAVVTRYIRAVQAVVQCKGKNFRQVCHNCRNYSNCLTYLEMYEAWNSLQYQVNSVGETSKEEFALQTFC